MTSDATYAKASIPIRQLGLRWTNWRTEEIRITLDHYSGNYFPGASKLELLRELHVLVQQRNLTTNDRVPILAGTGHTRTSVATAVTSSSAPQVSANFPPLVADRLYFESKGESTTSADHSNSHEKMEAYPETASFTHAPDANDLNSDTETRVDIDKKCAVCLESLTLEAFPTRKTTAACSHEPNVCLSCLTHNITSQSRGNMWNHIDCPSCRARLGYEDVRAFSTAAVFERWVLCENYNSRYP